MSYKILEYVDSVISNTAAPDEIKDRLENELIRSILEASEKSGLEKVKSSLCSPEKLAEELSKKVTMEYHKNSNPKGQSCNEPDYPRYRYRGEYMREQSNVNIKLLYIPLVQISSGIERLVMPLDD